MKIAPKGPEAAQIRRYQIPEDILPGSLSLHRTRCGKPNCRCAQGEGHPVWSLTYMAGGRKYVQHIPKRLVDEVRKRVEQGREYEAMGVSPAFGDGTLSCLTERLDPDRLREAAAAIVRQAKRNKAFEGSRWIGLALDGTGAGTSREKKCEWCRPMRNRKKEIVAYGHKLVRFAAGTAHQTFQDGSDRVEICDADDFDPWQTLHWQTVRVVRYCQHKPDGRTVEAYAQSFKARHEPKACSAGIICDPGRPAAAASRASSRRTRSGKNGNRPLQRVQKERACKEKARTSATGSIVGRR